MYRRLRLVFWDQRVTATSHMESIRLQATEMMRLASTGRIQCVSTDHCRDLFSQLECVRNLRLGPEPISMDSP